MKILIDHSNLIVGGGIQVGTSFVYDLRSAEEPNEYHIVQSVDSMKAVDTSQFPDNFYFYNLTEQETRSIFKRRKKVRTLENDIVPDCIFTTFGPSYHKSNFPKVVGFAIPYLIYTDSPFLLKNTVSQKLKYYLLSLLKRKTFLKNSDALVFETDNARQIFTEKTQSSVKMYTVCNTLNEIFLNPTRWKELDYDFSDTFNLLCLTSNYPHKNVAIVPEVIDILVNKYSFKNFKFLVTLEKNQLNFDEKYHQYIEFLGKIPLENIPDLYTKSHASFIPTLLEVFSATYIESMFMNRPIIASDMPFAKDICGDAAIFCESTNADNYASAIIKLYNDKNLQKNLIAKGNVNLNRFGTSMDRTKKYLEIIKRTAV